MLSLVCYYYWCCIEYWSPDHVNNNRHIVWNWFSVAVILMMFKYVNVICWISFIIIFLLYSLNIFILTETQDYFQDLYEIITQHIVATTKFQKKKEEKNYCSVITVCIEYWLNWLLCQWFRSINCRWSLWAFISL